MGLFISAADPEGAEAADMLNALSLALAEITGDDGRSSFNLAEMADPRAVFALARDRDGPCGCGAIRPLSPETAELKRMYATGGNGAAILHWLEAEARRLGYARVVLSMRAVNLRALRFYARHGYVQIPNFGRYAGRPQSICMGRCLD